MSGSPRVISQGTSHTMDSYGGQYSILLGFYSASGTDKGTGCILGYDMVWGTWESSEYIVHMYHGEWGTWESLTLMVSSIYEATHIGARLVWAGSVLVLALALALALGMRLEVGLGNGCGLRSQSDLGCPLRQRPGVGGGGLVGGIGDLVGGGLGDLVVIIISGGGGGSGGVLGDCVCGLGVGIGGIGGGGIIVVSGGLSVGGCCLGDCICGLGDDGGDIGIGGTSVVRASPVGRELRSKSEHDPVKTISIDRATMLLQYLKDKSIPKKYKEKLCLVWFSHFVIIARDINKVIKDDLLELAEDLEKFNNYPWGYDSYKLTVKYLLTKLSPRTITLYDFPWAFMVKDYPEKVSHPWILRWLAVKSNTRIKEVDIFIPPNDVELGMTSFITLGLVDTIADPVVELIKKELAGSTAIRRAVRQDFGVVSGGFTGGIVVGGGSHAIVVASHDDDHADAQEK
ncbi:putative glycerol-3-phosphate 2-O-acyltransferase 6-like [Capsicum annuum]|nr:putative glycerol-3-phosphate 2-O-acyltransferase 6-like [Capsicum annuum]